VRLQHGHGKILDCELAIFFEDERFHVSKLIQSNV
jgi:hypothetical protein